MSSFSDKMNEINTRRELNLQDKREEARRKETEYPSYILNLMEDEIKQSLERSLERNGFDSNGSVSSTIEVESGLPVYKFEDSVGGKRGYSKNVKCNMFLGSYRRYSDLPPSIGLATDDGGFVFYTASLDFKKSLIMGDITKFTININVTDVAMSLVNELKKNLLDDGITSSFYLHTYFMYFSGGRGNYNSKQFKKEPLDKRTYTFTVQNNGDVTALSSAFRADLVIESVYKK